MCKSQAVKPIKVPIADPKFPYPTLSPIILPKNSPAITIPVISKPKLRYFMNFGDKRGILLPLSENQHGNQSHLEFIYINMNTCLPACQATCCQLTENVQFIFDRSLP